MQWLPPRGNVILLEEHRVVFGCPARGAQGPARSPSFGKCTGNRARHACAGAETKVQAMRKEIEDRNPRVIADKLDVRA